MTVRARITIAFVMIAAVAIGVAASRDTAEAILPDGGKAPVVISASVEDPARHNRLLEADLKVEAYDDGEITAYEYRWSRATVGSIATTPAPSPTVDFRATVPETRFLLEVRAVDDEGWRSEWVVAHDGPTPSAPNLIVAGDSVASGYTRTWFTSDGTCTSPSASYGQLVADSVAASLPASWSPTYRNIARAGAGVYSFEQGGQDPCGASYSSQLEDVVDFADPSTWNVVVVTAGINSTNWGDVITSLTGQHAMSFSFNGDKDRCARAISEDWNLADRSSSIADQVGELAQHLIERTNADVYWTSYYDVTGHRIIGSFSPIGPGCTDEMRSALALLHATLTAELPVEVTWVDLGEASVPLQAWGGWPHPDGDGHRVIGAVVAETVVASS